MLARARWHTCRAIDEEAQLASICVSRDSSTRRPPLRKFTSSEASALIDQLLGEDPGASDVVVNDGPAVEAKKGPVEGSSDVVTLGVEMRQPGKPIRAARTSEPTDCRDSAPGGRRRARLRCRRTSRTEPVAVGDHRFRNEELIFGLVRSAGRSVSCRGPGRGAPNDAERGSCRSSGWLLHRQAFGDELHRPTTQPVLRRGLRRPRPAHRPGAAPLAPDWIRPRRSRGARHTAPGRPCRHPARTRRTDPAR